MNLISLFKNCFTIFLLLLLLTLPFGCKKNCHSEEINYTVSEDTKTAIPYTGFDTLTFVRGIGGDTHTFIGTGKTMDDEYSYVTAECPNHNKINSESFYFTYKSKTFSDPIVIGYNSRYKTWEHYLYFMGQKFEGDVFFGGSVPQIDSLYVSGKYYYDVQVIPYNNPGVNKIGAYFDENRGCIKIYLRNSQIWNLLSMKN